MSCGDHFLFISLLFTHFCCISHKHTRLSMSLTARAEMAVIGLESTDRAHAKAAAINFTLIFVTCTTVHNLENKK